MQDVQSRKVLIAAESKGAFRKDLSVADVMVDISDIPAVKYTKVMTSKIADVLHTMQFLGEHYLLVLDAYEQLRGFICSSDIRRAVQIPTDIAPKANGFSEILIVLHDHKEIN